MKKKSFALLLAAALLLCLLPRMAPEAKAETIRDKCRFCNTTADHEITRFERFNDDYHYVIYICSHCGNGSYALFKGNPISLHSGGTETPTCTTGKTCTRCGTQYGKLGHDWGAWQSRGNNSEHFRTCQRDGCDAVETVGCSGDSSATCITLGTCTTCGGQYYSAHTFPANQGWDSDAENHWRSCTVCHEAKTKVGALYCSAEANSQYQVDGVKKALEKKGISCTFYSFADSNDIATVAKKAASESDVIYVPTDNTAADNGSVIDAACKAANTPIIAGEEGIFKSTNAVATLSISFYNLGQKAGAMAYEILTKGTDPATMNIQQSDELTYYYNEDQAKAFKANVPDNYKAYNFSDAK